MIEVSWEIWVCGGSIVAYYMFVIGYVLHACRDTKEE